MDRLYSIVFLASSKWIPLFIPRDFLAGVQSIQLVSDNSPISDAIVFERIHIVNLETRSDHIDEDIEIVKFPRDAASLPIQFLYIQDM
jgi:hypothetical protein